MWVRLPPSAQYRYAIIILIALMNSERERQEVSIIDPIVSISILLSSLQKDLNYTVDTGRWSNAFMLLREQYVEKYPEFFGGISFRHSGTRIYSREVDQALTLLYFGDVVERRGIVVNP